VSGGLITNPLYCCPVCGVFGGGIQLGPGTFGACDRHRVRWLIQAGGYDWEEGWETVAAYREVPPAQEEDRVSLGDALALLRPRRIYGRARLLE
jgi:hypothetical protein